MNLGDKKQQQVSNGSAKKRRPSLRMPKIDIKIVELMSAHHGLLRHKSDRTVFKHRWKKPKKIAV